MNFIRSLYVHIILAKNDTPHLCLNKNNFLIWRNVSYYMWMWIECRRMYICMLVNAKESEEILSHSVKLTEFWIRDNVETCTRLLLVAHLNLQWMNRTNTQSNLQLCLLENSCRTALARRSIAPRRGTNVLGVIYTRLLKNSISPTTSVTSGMKISRRRLFILIN